MAKVNVAVVFGGRSSEHAISCVSAGEIMAAMDPAKYTIAAIGIAPDGRWLLQSGDERLAIEAGRLPSVESGSEVTLTSVPGRALITDAAHPLQGIDVVFPVLHGPWGEDGTIQGLLELAGLPYVGSGVYASSASMDKVHMKAAFRAAGLPTGDYEAITDRQWRTDKTLAMQRVSRLPLPVFVKPSRAGSSVGITKVNHADELEAAIDAARAHDPKVIVEAGIMQAREIECGVLVDESGTPRASVVGEIKVHPDFEFYDFDAKYIDDGADLIVPAELSPALAQRVRDTAIAAFEALDCEGLARVDFFITPQDEVLLNEVNTMPGFTPVSMFPRLWAASGVTYAQLIDLLVADAMRRGTGLR